MDSVFCSGSARLPQAYANTPAVLTVEIEVDPKTRSVLALFINPELGGLKRLLDSATVGRSIDDIPSLSADALKERYFSPLRNAARAALLHAWEAFQQYEGKQEPALLKEAG